MRRLLILSRTPALIFPVIQIIAWKILDNCGIIRVDCSAERAEWVLESVSRAQVQIELWKSGRRGLCLQATLPFLLPLLIALRRVKKFGTLTFSYGRIGRKELMNIHIARLSFLRSCLALASIGLAGFTSVQAQVPVFDYQFPASWDGAAATVTDLSAAGNDANPSGGVVLSTTVPPGSPAASRSIGTNDGGIATQNTSLLLNSAVAAAGGFRMDATFLWDGTDDVNGLVKIIDYAGTEFLQLQDMDLVGGTATLRFGFDDNAAIGVNLTTTIDANTWYDVSGIFNTQGNGVAGDGSLSGQATMIVNGATFVDNVTKTDQGDGLDRPIGVGGFSIASSILELHGNIFSASVELVPEPTAVTLTALGVGFLAICRLRKRWS